MASTNNVTAAGTVLPQDGDSLSETNLSRVNAKSNASDYVERGFGFNPDFANNELDIGNTSTAGNYAIIEGSNKAYEIFAEQETDILLPNTSGVNYVYLVHDPATDDDISYHIDDDDTPPSNPSLKIGTVDTSADTFDDTINREPELDAELLSMDPRDVRNISSPDEGDYADHDGSGSNTEGLARYNGSAWISQVDGSTIS